MASLMIFHPDAGGNPKKILAKHMYLYVYIIPFLEMVGEK
jgi:hypothetical protein